MSLQPVLQIIHVSDMHVVAQQNPPAASKVRFAERWAKKMNLNALWELFRDGTAPADYYAPFALAPFVRSITSADPDWSKTPAWFVDTGDQTTFGDAASLQAARAIVTKVVQGTHCQVIFSVHGNHDAWPEDLPFFAPHRIAAQRTALARQYAVRTVQSLSKVTLPSGGEIQLFSVDTVDDDAISNTLASGEIVAAQRAALANAIKQAARGHDLRILLAHHPIHYPPPRPPLGMAIKDDDKVGAELGAHKPGIHVVLSGHTHSLYPELQALPTSPQACNHQWLGSGQCQLVVGSLMQADRFNKRGKHAHQCQVLRLHQDPAVPGFVHLERRLASRNVTGSQPQLDYQFVDPPEWMTIPV